jgi:hypothetical protein
MRKQKPSRATRPRARRKQLVADRAGAVESAHKVPSTTSVADAARQRMISEAAYYRAQRRGFSPGRELDDWVAAEAEIAGYFLEQQPAASELH